MAVGITRATVEDVEPRLFELLDLIGYQPQKKLIFIKPNVVNHRTSESGVITHTAVVEGLIKYFRGHDCQVVIGEGSVMGSDCDEVLEASGYRELGRRHNVEVLNLNKVERVAREWRFGKIKLPSILETHEYVNVPTMKTHILTGVTLGIKNQKGLLAEKDKMKFHRDGIDDRLLELARVAVPALTVMDGLICIEGTGPGLSGDRKEVDLLVAGQDMVEVDNVCCRIMGFEPDEIGHIPTLEGVETVGLTVEEVRNPFKRPDTYYHKAHIYFHPGGSCSGCLDCVTAALRGLRNNPVEWVRRPGALARVGYHTVFGRMDFLAGRPDGVPEGAGRVICIGKCSEEFAREQGLRHVPGCPPKPVDVKKVL